MYTVGIDLGGTNIAAGICDSDLNLIIKGSVPTMASREPELIVKDMAALVDSLLQKAGIEVTLNETKGTMHGFDIATKAPTTLAAIAQRIAFMKQMM